MWHEARQQLDLVHPVLGRPEGDREQLSSSPARRIMVRSHHREVLRRFN